MNKLDKDCENQYGHKIDFSADFDDNVNHPTHYAHDKVECIDAMESAFGKTAVEDFCLINAFKYIWRSRDKNGLEDIEKAKWYLNKYEELMKKTSGNE